MAEDKAPIKPTETKEPVKPEPPKDNLVESKNSVVIGGREIKYTATAGTIVMKEEQAERDKEFEGEKPRAQIFFTAYTKDDVADRSKRPISFCFNGGPGSASIWLHMGVLGPRRVVLNDDGTCPPPPFRLQDNEYSLLDETDIVMIDPMSTGFSRPVEGQKAKDWHGFGKDISSVGDFIRLYVTRYNRWLSPKFLIGESYGTTRSAGLAGYLEDKHGLVLNGIMLVSVVLDFTTIEFPDNNDLPYVLFLPAYAATAYYHKKVRTRKPLPAFLAEVERFANGEYATALLKGDLLSKRERAQIVAKVSGYTGISPEFIERTDLRIIDQHFFKELLRDRGLVVGRLDSRLLGHDRRGVTDHPEIDPLFPNISGPFTAAWNDYVRTELKFEADRVYNVSGDVHPWSYSEFEDKFVFTGESLRAAMAHNPFLKVFIASGYFDLGTPYSATDYTVAHLGLTQEERSRVQTEYYEAGHMMYIHKPSLAKFKADMAAFIRGAMPG